PQGVYRRPRLGELRPPRVPRGLRSPDRPAPRHDLRRSVRRLPDDLGRRRRLTDFARFGSPIAADAVATVTEATSRSARIAGRHVEPWSSPWSVDSIRELRGS